MLSSKVARGNYGEKPELSRIPSITPKKTNSNNGVCHVTPNIILSEQRPSSLLTLLIPQCHLLVHAPLLTPSNPNLLLALLLQILHQQHPKSLGDLLSKYMTCSTSMYDTKKPSYIALQRSEALVMLTAIPRAKHQPKGPDSRPRVKEDALASTHNESDLPRLLLQLKDDANEPMSTQA